MKIEILFDEVCNLFGDYWNGKYLEMTLDKAKVYHTTLLEEPRFIKEDINLIYMGSMSENIEEKVIEKFKPYKKRIKELIDKGTVFLMTGNAMEIMGKEIIDGDKKISCLNIFDIVTTRDYEHRYNSLFWGYFNEDVVGYKSQFSNSIIKEKGLFEVKRELNGSITEGMHVKNFFGTNILGPILILNPFFTKYLLSLIGYNDKLLYEEELVSAYKVRLEEYKKEGIKY